MVCYFSFSGNIAEAVFFGDILRIYYNSLVFVFGLNLHSENHWLKELYINFNFNETQVVLL